MDIIYVDILTGEILASVKVASLVRINWTVFSLIGWEKMEGGTIISFDWKYHFRVGENMVQHPSNYKSVVICC